ncbi:MAG: lysine--tRNA ligase [Nitrospiraceae bacterium]|nr:lysine--tRNA ligase [Nitrospiraceae bacterium]
MNSRIKKLNKLREIGINPYPYKYNQTHYSVDIKKEFESIEFGNFSDKEVNIAGRIVSLRDLGKLIFSNIRDEKGDIQILFKKDILNEKFKILKLIDIGDFIGVTGKVSKTKTNEITVFANDFTILSKSIRPLPEKYHGIKDIELKYRQRHLDLIMNRESREVFIKRSRIISEIRKYLDDKGFIEVENPILEPVYGGANARPFITYHNSLNRKLYLKISPELYLKRLMIGGLGKVYEITKCFRNEGIDKNHNPEFTMIEWYIAYKDYNDMMDMVEDLIKKVCLKVNNTLKIEYQGVKLDLSKPWRRMPMKEAIKKYLNLDVDSMSFEDLRTYLIDNNIELKGNITKGMLIGTIFDEFVDSKLIEPTFITDYPVETSPLTKKNRNNPELTERFELFINGMELSNAYSELNDPIDQRERFEKQEKEREMGNDEAPPKDYDFLDAMEYGMPPTGGVGIGIDRLVMVLTNQESIRDVILFPTMKDKENTNQNSEDSNAEKSNDNNK